ncbi:MAG TPA: hypothetical protein VL651_14730, partial [Bacteroidia bacterium]|nr:hypothetical protein [Bacteroidia bacterium]
MKKKLPIILFACAAFSLSAQKAQHDKGGMQVYKNPFFANIKTQLNTFNTAPAADDKRFMMDYTG